MASVRIIVDDATLGRVEVEEDDHIGSYRPETQRAAIEYLLTRANAKIYRAYQLSGEEPAAEVDA